jgi:hypothetical protein
MIISEKNIRKIIRRLLEEDFDSASGEGIDIGFTPRNTSSSSSEDEEVYFDFDGAGIEKEFGTSDESTVIDFISKTSFTAPSEKDIDLDTVFEMSGATGIKPSAIFGIMRVESSGNSSAMATNPHKISGEPGLYSEPFGIDHKEVTTAWKKAGIPMESLYNFHINS